MSSQYCRLPSHIIPCHYYLRLEPNFETFSFDGEVRIITDVGGDSDINEIAVNANKLKVHELTVIKRYVTVSETKDDTDEDGQPEPKRRKSDASEDVEKVVCDWSVVNTRCEPVRCSYEVLEEEEVILIKFASPVPVSSSLAISVRFSGVLDDSMRGFYRTKHTVAGTTRWGAACHFEATGARKCFPCFDQPEFRSTYDICVARPEPGMEVLSNMPPRQVEGSLVTFATTPPLPSYLVCVVVGWYSALGQRSAAGVPVTVYTPQADTTHGLFALEVAVKAVDYFQEFFSTPYTLPKMDLVAVPDFYIGAMENWGLLTFRETALLFDPAVATTSAKQYVSILVSHEIAHQWFGNLVGIRWWDQLWLKEGFASWISFLAVDKIFPQFDIWSQFLTTEKMLALNLDHKSSSHPIKIPDGVDSPAQIDEIFDDISYSKGASIINMLYHWLGGDTFAAGLALYLARHRGTCARTDQLWSALETRCSRPVAEVMEDWVDKQGYPLVHVDVLASGIVNLHQKEFGSSPHNIWKIPLKFEFSVNGGSTQTIDYMLDKAEAVVQLEDHNVAEADYFLVNAGQTSYCRVLYSPQLLSKLTTNLRRLHVRDQVGVLADCAALLATGDISLEQLLATVRCYEGATLHPVVSQLCEVAGDLETLYEGTSHWAAFLQTWYQVLAPGLHTLGWDPVAGEGEDARLARAELITRLGRLGHTDTVGRCWLRWHHHQDRGQELHRDIRRPVLATVARTATWEVTSAMIRMYEETSSAETRRVLRVLAANTNTQVAARVLDWLLTDEVKLQDKSFLLAAVASTGRAGRSLAWQWFVKHSGQLLATYTSGGLLKNLVRAATGNGAANTSEEADTFAEWFSQNQVEGVQRTVQQIVEETRKTATLRRDLFSN